VPTYAIGDIQGCCDEFEALLQTLRFDPTRDRLWIVGDLVNRGPRSLDVLRLVRGLGNAAQCVLGNHDLHLLAIRYGGHSPNRGDTFDEILASDDAEALCQWLRGLPLLVHDEALNWTMTHAGIPHIWSLKAARERAAEVEAALRGDGYRDFLRDMYGNHPPCWDDRLTGMDRLRAITNYFTRLRLVNDEGCMEFSHKGTLADAPAGWHPWFELRARRPLGSRLVFGHWAAIEGRTGVDDIVALDTGCVWGRSLTALCLESGESVSIPAH
jgi:bis(5'-nucleosyl)-tetraphosphatase (symmetrical)